MPVVSKSELKAKMLEYFREVERTGEELIVLDNRVPVLKVCPIRTRRAVAEIFGPHRAKVKYAEELTKPTTGEWTEV